MSADQDRKFFDAFIVVLGALVGVAVAIYFLAQFMAERTQGQFLKDDPAAQMLIKERIRPIGQVAIAGRDNSGLPSPGGSQASAAPAVEAAETAVAMSGEEVYKTACAACHAAGVAGAPKLGDSGAWEPRIAQGRSTLLEHALKGFQGPAGFMPAKGGRPDLSDDAVTAAVDYMTGNSD